MYQNYIFDLYGTLVDIRTNEEKPYLWKKMADLLACYHVFYDWKKLKKIYKYHLNSLEENLEHVHGEISIEKVWECIFREVEVEVNRESIENLCYTFRVLSREYVRLYPGVEELLSNLKKKGKRIYLLSNAQRLFTQPEMEQLGIIPYFDGIFYSSDHGIKKPASAFMKALLARYNLSTEASIMIGNDGSCDVGTAKAVGMDCLYIHSNISPEWTEEMEATYVIMDGDVSAMEARILR